MTHEEALGHMLNMFGQQQEDAQIMNQQEEKDQLPQVDKDQYIFAKARATIELIRAYFI